MQVRSEDLRLFVEVLQNLHPEPADLVQLRASEAQLRSRMAKLQAEVDGHHLQQTIKHLQQAEVCWKSTASSLLGCCTITQALSLYLISVARPSYRLIVTRSAAFTLSSNSSLKLQHCRWCCCNDLASMHDMLSQSLVWKLWH